MLEEGYIKLYRSMLKWEWYDDINTFRVFLHLLLTVNHYDERWRGVEVKRGQRICSYGKLAKETKLSVKNVRTALNHLKSTGEVAHQATAEYGLFTVVNYGKYQQRADLTAVEGQTSGSQSAVKGQQSKKARKQEGKNKDIIDSDKTQFAEFVSMTLAEHDRLSDKLGEHGAKRCIEILDNYKGANGKEYVSDYRAILNWVVKRYEEEPKPEPEPIEYVSPKPEDDAPFRKSLPEGADLTAWLPPAQEENPW